MIKIAQPIIKEEEIRAVEKVLKTGMIAQSPMVAEFEKKFAGILQDPMANPAAVLIFQEPKKNSVSPQKQILNKVLKIQSIGIYKIFNKNIKIWKQKVFLQLF